MTDSEQEREQDDTGDGFPAEDVMPDDPDPDLDVNDPFGVGDDREPLEGDGQSDDGDGED